MDDVAQLSKQEFGYTRLESKLLEEVIACFRVQPDYMSSSSSIYKKKELVLTGPPPDQIRMTKIIS